MLKKVLLYIMAVLYIAAGINHFVNRPTYRKLMPAWLPLHEQFIIISGVFEIMFGVLLFFSKTRSVGAYGLIALLVAVFPANIQMAIDYAKDHNPNLWIAILRLPLQFVLIWWAYVYTKPFNHGRRQQSV